MKLYKYKSLRNFEHVADIICHKRFYTSLYYDLNDPMEGLFNCHPETKQEYLSKIKEDKKRLRICSFSEDPLNILLWAHYADSFKGVCIEIEMDENLCFDDFEVKKVTYDPNRILFRNESSRLIDELPEMILSQKAKEWDYEREVRLLSSQEYIQCGIGIKITSILLGVSIQNILRETIIKITPLNIKIMETRIGDTNKIELGPEIKRGTQGKQTLLPL